MDCSDATTGTGCVFTAACYVTSVSHYATTLMADGVLAGASGWRLVDDGRAGGTKKSRQSLLRELYRENTPVGVDGFEPPTLC